MKKNNIFVYRHWFVGIRKRFGLSKQVSLFTLTAIIGLWVAIGIGLSQLYRLAETESKTELENLTLAFAEEVNSSVNTIDLSLIGLRSHWIRDRNGYREIISRLQAHLQDEVSFQVSILDAKGRLVFSSADPNAKAIDLSDREHFKIHTQRQIDRLFISAPVLGRVSNQWSIQFTRSIYDIAGHFDGVIVISVAPAYFSRFYHRIKLGESAAVTLVRADGTIVARSPREGDGIGMGTRIANFQVQRSGPHLTGIYHRASEVDGIERLNAWRSLPKYELTVIVGKAEEVAFDRYREQYRVYILSGIGMTMLIIGIGYFVLASARQKASAMAALAESEARWNLALSGAEDGVWDWNIGAGTLQLSRRSKEILGVAEDVLPATPEALQKLVHPDDLMQVEQALVMHLRAKTHSYKVEHRVLAAEKGERWVLAKGMVVRRNENGEPVRMLGTYSDVTSRKQEDNAIKYRAEHDTLTGLPNRHLFADRLRQCLLRAKRENTCFSVIYFDLDKFKAVNDQMGHDAGDLLLKEVGRRVTECLRDSDTVARIGGDEFVVLLATINTEEHAATVAQSILEALLKPFIIQGCQVSVGASLGVATYPSHGNTEEVLLRCADQAMYQAKTAGRGRIRVHHNETSGAA
ncbi:sensor domain-containing diguanylate cyclase [Noviherbaspirillum malthae]|jgi:diguanylate cyclase (GGDEF)-like protein/PAS domain S-box-containing protein|uniref:sensor domain-containing diguanylate cyclase n=1 Tax=Noviherbaspirillum malthae TaxID=1260987 RepID=UPI00188FEB14|nr:diguanylate cyclase [Noviherbaspirillum malthae]